ncbi:hypothetical protein HHO41_12555 [Bacillus sp. DNRA2]|uniref:hypothetical protein n=1 Tax=Bacillus sp. DNRA2 TaxID=2723053 RepID=UPI00145E1542|nr:hypothetical protein [Bacillus sp. DNRA2]NMD71130.1 hypothetical protein [Bacillus sp. DNRA2]
MAITLPHIETANTTHYIPPKGEYIHFSDEKHFAEKVREWGLSSAKDVKKEFWYKERTLQRLVTIKGYESYGVTGEFDTLVIQFQDGNLSCINPALLKEMQSASFAKELMIQTTTEQIEALEDSNRAKSSSIDSTTSPESQSSDSGEITPKAAQPSKVKKEKAPKLILPEEKVHFTAQVKQFALSWNHFNEENDEVVILENVRIDSETPVEVGLAWCAHSKTLKKFELTPAETLEFDGKIVKKSLPKGKDIDDEALRFDGTVAYKINNPSKLKKL